jgi:hypothetical protein
MKPGFAVAVEVLECRAAPSEFIITHVGGGLLMGLMPTSPGATSPPVENFLSHGGVDDALPIDPLQSTVVVESGRSELPSDPPRQESGSTSQPANVPPSVTAETSRKEILPAVLDAAVSSRLHLPALGRGTGLLRHGCWWDFG